VRRPTGRCRPRAAGRHLRGSRGRGDVGPRGGHAARGGREPARHRIRPLRRAPSRRSRAVGDASPLLHERLRGRRNRILGGGLELDRRVGDGQPGRNRPHLDGHRHRRQRGHRHTRPVPVRAGSVSRGSAPRASERS
jgi:hypothetical protein